MALVDKNGRPVEETKEEGEGAGPEKPKNGEGKIEQEGRVDARLIPRGLLIYNLIECRLNMLSAEAQIQGMQMMMQQQKMVVEPPQMQLAKAQHAEAERTRAIIVTNLNERFRSADERYWAELGPIVEDRTQSEEEPDAE